jgi:serine/threonine-protein kinase RIO1
MQMQMQIRLDEYIIDLYQSFKCNKKNIDEQLDRDFHRLIFYFNSSRIMTKLDFYTMLNGLPYRRIHKQILWVLPTQVSLFIFYKFLADTFAKEGYMVCEIPEGNVYTNQFIIRVNTQTLRETITVEIKKNFRYIKMNPRTREIDTIGYIFMNIDMPIISGGIIKMIYSIIPVNIANG